MDRKLILTPLLVLTLVLYLALMGCSSSDATDLPEATQVAEAGQGTLTVYAAASLTDAFSEIGQVFEALHPGATVAFNFASSSTLANQLAEGAPAHVFASANAKQMQNAVAADRIAGQPIDFATNKLVVITPADNPANIETLADLADEGVRLVSAMPAVPIRDFTEEMLAKASADPALGDDFKAAVLANLVSEESDVRQIVIKVSLGEADAGIVYSSDVTPTARDQLQVIQIADAFNVTALYPIGLVTTTPGSDLAQPFIDFVLSAEGQAILLKWGFGPKPGG